MDRKSEMSLGTIKSWGRHVMRELAAVERLLAQGLAFSPAEKRSAHDEIVALVEPHLAVLAYKRARSCGGDGMTAAQWVAELSRFVASWPHLAARKGGRSKLVAELDRIIAAEQKRLADNANSSTVPVTSRFDTSWAT